MTAITKDIKSLFLQDLLISAGDLADSFLWVDRVDQDGVKVNHTYCNRCHRTALGAEELVHADDCLAGRVSKLIAAIEGPDLVALPEIGSPVDCMDCARPYPHGLDMVLTKKQWLMVNPDDGGVLCPSCIVNRAEKLPHAISIYAHIVLGEHYDTGDSLENMLVAIRMENSNYSRENAELKYATSSPVPLGEPAQTVDVHSDAALPFIQQLAKEFGFHPEAVLKHVRVDDDSLRCMYAQKSIQLMATLATKAVPTGQPHLPPQPTEQHIAYEVEEHPWASEEGNCPNLGRTEILTHEEAAADRRGVLA